MKRILFGAVAVTAVLFVASAGTANAADLSVPAAPPVRPCTWCGFYVGVNAGYGLTVNSTMSIAGTDTGAAGLGSLLAAGSIPGSVGDTLQGFAGGGQIGYNWQFFRDLVFGLEADFDGLAGMNKTTSTGPILVPGFPTVTTQNDWQANWLSTVRARFGSSVFDDRLFIYGTAGIAIAQWQLSTTFICPGCVPPSATEASTSSNEKFTRVGGAIGFGAEWVVVPHLTFRVEYLFTEVGASNDTITYTYPGNTSSLTTTARDGINDLRAGINWLF